MIERSRGFAEASPQAGRFVKGLEEKLEASKRIAAEKKGVASGGSQ
jgi:hypothetical protein